MKSFPDLGKLSKGELKTYSKFFGSLASLHAVAAPAEGWRTNASFFSSSLRFYAARKDGDFHYKLGKTIDDIGKRKALDRSVDAVFSDFPKGKLLKAECEAAGLFLDCPPLWIPPSTRKKDMDGAAEKLLIFTNLVATPLEVLERLRDPLHFKREKKSESIFRKSTRFEDVSLCWLRPSTLLQELGGSEDKDLDRESWDRAKIKKALNWEKVWGEEANRRRREHSRNTPGTQVMLALAMVLAEGGISQKDVLRAFEEDRKVMRALVHLKREIDHYLGNSRAQKVMARALRSVDSDPAKLAQKYCIEFKWKEMWVEYWDQLLGTGVSSNELGEILMGAFEEAAEALGFKAFTKFRFLKRGRRSKRKTVFESHLGTTFGEDGANKEMRKKGEDVQGSNRQEAVRNAFNSPFAPFVLVTTSVGEEGLDFHRYCRRQVHWDPPRSATALAQRIGRVMRYRGLLQRRALAGGEKSGGFIWKREVSKGAKWKELEPDFQPPDFRKNQPSISIFALPSTNQYGLAQQVLSHYADMKYFVGLSESELAQIIGQFEGLSAAERKWIKGLEVSFK